MAWIKRNLVLVISGVITLALFGLGGFYLFSAIKKNDQLDKDNEGTRAEIKRLLEKPVTPTAESLKAAKLEGQRLNQFIADAKRLFPGTPPPAQPLTTESFKSLLAFTVNDLHKQASALGIKIDSTPAGPYYFSFDSQRLQMNFPPESLRPLSERLHEVQLMSEVLIKSRVNRLNGIRRVMVVGERPTGGAGAPGGSSDYLPGSARSNPETGMAVWPYELTFECFSAELASVLEGLQRSRFGILVKSVSVEPAAEVGTQGPIRRGDPPRNLPRNQLGGVTPAAAPAAGQPPLVTIINEKLLRVTLRLEVIKPDPMPQGGPGPGGPRGPRGGNP